MEMLKYQGGRILTEIRPMALWAEVTWSDGTESVWDTASDLCWIDQFFRDILDSSYLQAVSQTFSVAGKTIGAGQFLGTSGLGIKPPGLKGQLPDSDIQLALQDAVINGLLPWPSEDTCYFIFIPSDAIVLWDGGQSQKDFGGYHNYSVTRDGRILLYCVIAPSNGGDQDVLTESTSHELVEAITDPDPPHGWIGPADIQGKLTEVCDLCFPGTASIHGYSVSTFATSASETGGSPGELTVTCRPPKDSTPRGTSTSAKIKLDPEPTRLSCLGSIIEGQSAFFHAQVLYRSLPAAVASYNWSVTHIQPPNAQVLIPGSTQQANFSVEIPFGVTAFDIVLNVTTALGCSVQATGSFRVVTQAQADHQNVLCTILNRLVEFFKWPLPLPPWDPGRDFGETPLTRTELENLALFGEELITFVRVARTVIPFGVKQPNTACQEDQEDQEAASAVGRHSGKRLPSAHVAAVPPGTRRLDGSAT
jgi:hypothetical protein